MSCFYSLSLLSAWWEEQTLNRRCILSSLELVGKVKNEGSWCCTPATKWTWAVGLVPSSLQCRGWEGTTAFWTSIKCYSWLWTDKQTHPSCAWYVSGKLFIDFSHDFRHNVKLLHISWTAVAGCMLDSSCWQSKVKDLFLNLNKIDLNYLTFAVG